jgi:hypothetical protein
MIGMGFDRITRERAMFRGWPKHWALSFAAMFGAITLASAAVAAGTGCDAGKWPLSAVRTHFSGTLPGVANGESLPALGQAVLVTLAPQADAQLPHAPSRPPKISPSFAGAVKLGPEPSATYQVSVSAGAWVDLVENGDIVKQTGFVRRRDCDGVDKSIRFKTAGGPLVIQISGSAAKTIKVEAARAE